MGGELWRVCESVGFVVDLQGDPAQAGFVPLSMVCAEEELSAARQPHPDVGLGAAAIAAVSRGQRGRGKRSIHIASFRLSRFYPRQHESSPGAFLPGITNGFALGVALPRHWSGSEPEPPLAISLAAWARPMPYVAPFG